LAQHHSKHRLLENEDLAPLVEIIQFLSRNWKFLGLVTIVLSTLAIALSLLSPKQYQKQLSLRIKTTSFPLSSQSLFPAIDVNQTGTLAVEFIKSTPLDQITTTARYEAETQRIAISLESPNARALSSASPKIISQLRRKFQEPISQILATSLMVTDLQLNRQQQILPQLDRQIAQSPPTDTPRVEALETERAKSVAAIAALQVDKNYLQQSQKNLPDFTAKVLSVQVLSESEAEQARSSGQSVIMAVVASFIVAVVAAIIRNQIPQLKSVLSKAEINSGTEV
jgi:capsular polysaccharide biosynthesis protein